MRERVNPFCFYTPKGVEEEGEITMNNDQEKEEEIQWETELNRQILELIFRLYDDTFKDLVNR